MDNKTLVEKISRLLELSEEEAEELYDVVDTLYNEYSSKYIEAILKPEENRELVNQFITVTKQLLEKENRSFIEELALIAALDIIAMALHDKLIGFIEVEEEEEEGEL
jgi:hypothetical protein